MFIDINTTMLFVGFVMFFILFTLDFYTNRLIERNHRDERFRVFSNMQRLIEEAHQEEQALAQRDREELEQFKQKDIEAKELAQRRRVSPAQKDAVLRRDGYKCQICGISREYLDEKVPGLGDYLRLEVDHIIPIAQGGKSDESNLQCLCWRCNAAKGSTKSNNQVNSMRTWGAGHLPGVSKKK